MGEQAAARSCIVERDSELGGILNQCIHNGFGLHYFKEELTGPEYAGRFIKMLSHRPAYHVRLGRHGAGASPRTRSFTAVSREDGYVHREAKAGHSRHGLPRAHPRRASTIPGTRPAGVFTAGAAQRYVNMEGYMPGQAGRHSRLGRHRSHHGAPHDARGREGARLSSELMPYSGGLNAKHRAVPQ